MGKDYPFELLDDPAELARLGEWNEQVYRDFDAYRSGRLSEAAFRSKYVTRVAIFCLDMTGFTKSAIRFGEIESLLRIHDVQKVCLPVFRTFAARLTRAFADDLTALFDNPHHALDAALEIHRRIALFNGSAQATRYPAQCCIGIGFGDVFAIGPDLAMGDEMNRASKLGEDTARANETLITENLYEAVKDREDCLFERQSNDELIFPFYSVIAAAS
jgi:class 3 adenylate cyclase